MNLKEFVAIPKRFTSGLIRELKINLIEGQLTKQCEETEEKRERTPDGEYQRTEMGFGANIH